MIELLSGNRRGEHASNRAAKECKEGGQYGTHLNTCKRRRV